MENLNDDHKYLISDSIFQKDDKSLIEDFELKFGVYYSEIKEENLSHYVISHDLCHFN